jgi:hypothetical protein
MESSMVTSDVTSLAMIWIVLGNLLCKAYSLKYTKSKKNYLNWPRMSRYKCVWICTHIVEIMAFLHTVVSITNNVENYLPYSRNLRPSSDMELVLLESWAKNSIQRGPQSMEWLVMSGLWQSNYQHMATSLTVEDMQYLTLLYICSTLLPAF